MNAKVDDLMTASVVTTEPHRSIDHVRKMLAKSKIGAIPVVGPDDEVVGIVSTTDLAQDLKGGSPIKRIMTEKVYSVSRYDDVSTAARVMRNHGIHRVVVTEDKKVVGMLTTFDLLQLVEGHRFVAKNPPTPSKRKAVGKG